MIVCNGETPCPLLTANEGDIVEITVHNNLYAQSSIHWYVVKVSSFVNLTCDTGFI